MEHRVICLHADKQILWPIVERVTVDMVDYLAALKRSAQRPLAQ